ncbi:MAG: hypothetical protein ACXVYV_02965 [Gaiellales bacterium]
MSSARRGLAGLGAALLDHGQSTRELVGFAGAALLFWAAGAILLLFWQRDVPEFRPVPEGHRELGRGGVVRLALRARGTLFAAALVPGRSSSAHGWPASPPAPAWG